ncbi:hypothetical protein AC249_AIPGENE6797 [Exaiptasia diaphana]|nr:hypothetical protein AC249_AIPGENE6797 [Exaiptasia diaphana]
MKTNPRVAAREKTHVIDTSSCQSVQEIAVRMQHAQQKEKSDPMNVASTSSAQVEVDDSELTDHSQENTDSTSS